ncbi:MAG: dTDP-4-dehydrorhamnose reductase [Chitinispirillaceae bacterium]
MKILVIGSKGQLGSDMCISCRKHGHQVWPVDVPDIDITTESSVRDVISGLKPEVVINCAAFTDVDACEQRQELAFAVNGIGVENIGRQSATVGSRVIHISTDYVFDGTKKSAYIETDSPCPQSIYGKSKLAGEEALGRTNEKSAILRVAWLYGVYGKNFVKTIRRVARQKAQEGAKLSVVNDQFGTPTYTGDVCAQTLKILQDDYYGIFHCTNEGECTWFDFASHIIDCSGISVQIEPCTTDAFPRPAPRPHNSVLENKRLKEAGIHCMRDWKDAFASFLKEEKVSE